jgi:hypothetical protein
LPLPKRSRKLSDLLLSMSLHPQVRVKLSCHHKTPWFLCHSQLSLFRVLHHKALLRHLKTLHLIIPSRSYATKWQIRRASYGRLWKAFAYTHLTQISPRSACSSSLLASRRYRMLWVNIHILCGYGKQKLSGIGLSASSSSGTSFSRECMPLFSNMASPWRCFLLNSWTLDDSMA